MGNIQEFHGTCFIFLKLSGHLNLAYGEIIKMNSSRSMTFSIAPCKEISKHLFWLMEEKEAN